MDSVVYLRWWTSLIISLDSSLVKLL